MEIVNIPRKKVCPQENGRNLNQETVENLKKSIREIGLKTPLTVKKVCRGATQSLMVEGYEVITGSHRLAACDSIGLDEIPCIIVDDNPEECRKWEIAENLHRAELTALQRAEQTAEWMRLIGEEVKKTEESPKENLVEQVAPLKPGHGQGAKGGIREAARQLGITRDDARRAAKVAGLTPEAKEAAVNTGLDNNQQALLEAAKLPKKKQAEYLRERADIGTDQISVKEERIRRAVNEFLKLKPDERKEFFKRIDKEEQRS